MLRCSFPQPFVEDPIESYTPTSTQFLQDYAFFVQLSDTTGEIGTSSLPLQSQVTSLEAEVLHLREQLAKAKGVNDVMWETVVQKVIPLANSKDKKAATTGDDDAESERKKKRGRI